jgi:hypothetical protein
MNVIELREPRALLIPDIQNLLKRALLSIDIVAPNGFDAVAADLFEYVTNPTHFMLLGAEEGTFRSVIMGFLPHGNLFSYPTIVVMYNEGSRALSKATQDELLDFLLARGYTRMLAANSSGHPDDVWLRGLTPAGATSEIIGSLAMFKVK